MGMLKVHGGDFTEQEIYFLGDTLVISGKIKNEKIPSKKLKSVEVATEETVKKLPGSIGLGLIGGLLLGPVGIIAGALAGGNNKVITFVATFHDGRSFVATTDPSTFATLKAEALNSSYKAPVLKRDIRLKQYNPVCPKCNKEKDDRPFSAKDECNYCGEKLLVIFV